VTRQLFRSIKASVEGAVLMRFRSALSHGNETIKSESDVVIIYFRRENFPCSLIAQSSTLFQIQNLDPGSVRECNPSSGYRYPTWSKINHTSSELTTQVGNCDVWVSQRGHEGRRSSGCDPILDRTVPREQNERERNAEHPRKVVKEPVTKIGQEVVWSRTLTSNQFHHQVEVEVA
jgi:hypothetical protein